MDNERQSNHVRGEGEFRSGQNDEGEEISHDGQRDDFYRRDAGAARSARSGGIVEGRQSRMEIEGPGRSNEWRAPADPQSSDSRYAGQGGYGGLRGDPEFARMRDEYQSSEHGQRGLRDAGRYGQGNYGGDPGATRRGGLSSYGQSSGSYYSLDNEFGEGTVYPGGSPAGGQAGHSSFAERGSQFAEREAHARAHASAGRYDPAIVTRSGATPLWDTQRDLAAGTRPTYRMPKGYTRSDERIREELCERLAYQTRIDVSDVSVHVKDGHVELEGTVGERHMKHAIEDIADAVMGVHDVENRIRVRQRAFSASRAAPAADPGRSSQGERPAHLQTRSDIAPPGQTLDIKDGVLSESSMAPHPKPGLK